MDRRWLALLASVALAACTEDITDVAEGVYTGALQIRGWTGFVPARDFSKTAVSWDQPPRAADVVPPRVIEAPDTVNANVAFDVVTYTVGPSGCWRAAGQQVGITERVVQLRPLDQHSGAPICTMALVFPAHRSQVVLREPGAWTLRVIGRRADVSGESLDGIVKAETIIIVR
jgi:hypothetical protein